MDRVQCVEKDELRWRERFRVSVEGEEGNSERWKSVRYNVVG